MDKTVSDTQKARLDAIKGKMRAAIGKLRELSRLERFVLLALVTFWQFGGLWPKHETIGGEAGYCERHVRTALARLKERGLLTWERRRFAGNQTSNLYRFSRAFWALVRGEDVPEECRRQPAQPAAGSRQPVPANRESGNPVSPKREGETAREHASAPPPPSVEVEELRRTFAEERARKYPVDLEHGTMMPEREHAAAGQLAGLAGEAVAWAAARGQLCDPAAVRQELTRAAIVLWLAHPGSKGADTPDGLLVARRHKYGLLGGDVARFGGLALAAWRAARRPRPAELRPIVQTSGARERVPLRTDLRIPVMFKGTVGRSGGMAHSADSAPGAAAFREVGGQ